MAQKENNCYIYLLHILCRSIYLPSLDVLNVNLLSNESTNSTLGSKLGIIVVLFFDFVVLHVAFVTKSYVFNALA